MDGGHDIRIESGDAVVDDAAATPDFVYVPGRTLYMMPFTDADEEEAWDRVVEERNR